MVQKCKTQSHMPSQQIIRVEFFIFKNKKLFSRLENMIDIYIYIYFYKKTFYQELIIK